MAKRRKKHRQSKSLPKLPARGTRKPRMEQLEQKAAPGSFMLALPIGGAMADSILGQSTVESGLMPDNANLPQRFTAQTVQPSRQSVNNGPHVLFDSPTGKTHEQYRPVARQQLSAPNAERFSRFDSSFDAGTLLASAFGFSIDTAIGDSLAETSNSKASSSENKSPGTISPPPFSSSNGGSGGSGTSGSDSGGSGGGGRAPRSASSNTGQAPSPSFNLGATDGEAASETVTPELAAAVSAESDSEFVISAPADFNSDGSVDAGDFNNWQANFGASEDATSAMGDADGDADVDGADFLAWQRGFDRQVDVIAKVTTVPGDFNADGAVDGDDSRVWAENFGKQQGASTTHGDADNDGDVDGGDFLTWQRNYSANETTNVPLAEVYLPGDFDDDGGVDGADFLNWQRNMGLLSNATIAQGDADLDGDVDQFDNQAWEANFGANGSTILAASHAECPVLSPTASRDDSDWGYNERGVWQDGSQTDAGWQDDYRTISAGTGENTAEWVTILEPGEYEIFATWPADIAHATDAGFEILDGATSLATVTRDQTIEPHDGEFTSRKWSSLGVYDIATGVPTVRLSDDASGIVAADGVLFVPTTTDIVLAEGGANFVREHRQQVSVGPADGVRLIKIDIAAAFDTSDELSAVEDVFSVYLVNPANPSETVLDRGMPGTSLFSLSGDTVEFATGLVRFDGQFIEIDVSGVESHTEAELVLQVINSDLDTGTRVSIRSIDQQVDEELVVGELVLNDNETIAPGAAVDLASYSSATDISLNVSNIRYDSNTGNYVAAATLANVGSSTGRKVVAQFPGLPSGVELSNASGVDGNGVPYVNFHEAIRSGGLRQNEFSESVELQFANPNAVRFSWQPEILSGGANVAPNFPAIGPLEIKPGEVLQVPLLATDGDGDPVSYSIVNESQLPTGRLRADGILEFSPTLEDIGNYTFTLNASDGAEVSSQQVSLAIVADVVTTTRLSGVVLDTDSQPLVGVPIELGSLQTVTNNSGEFFLEQAGAFDADTLLVRGEAITGAQSYPFIAEKLPLLLGRDAIAGVNNVVARPIYLPVLDLSQAVSIDPAVDVTATATLAAGEAAAEVFVSAGSLMQDDGAGNMVPFSGMLSITEVPRSRTPAALPEGLLPDTVVTIQPGEMVFTEPAELTLPNRAGYAPGTLMDLWSINPETGQFDNVGTGEVTSDGSSIITISGGIRNSSWHLFTPPTTATDPGDAGENSGEGCGRCKATSSNTSEIELHSGAILETHNLVSYQSLGTTQGLTLHYNSLHADPRPIVHFGFDFARSGNRLVVGRLGFSRGSFVVETQGWGGGLGLPGGEHFWSLPEGTNEIKVAIQGDLSDQPTGVYDYNLARGVLQLQSGLFSGTMPTATGKLVHINDIASPFGSGWQIGGTQKIAENPDGSLLLVDGNGLSLIFQSPGSAGGPYESPAGDFSVMQKHPDGTFTRTTKDQTVSEFDNSGRLKTITDRNSNQTVYSYDGPNGQISSIVDPVGLETTFQYTAGKVTSVTDPFGRVTSLSYDTSGNLTRISNPDGTSRSFDYDSKHHIAEETDQRGNVEQTHYGFHGRSTGGTRKDGTSLQFDIAQTRFLDPPEQTSSLFSVPPANIFTSQTVATSRDVRGQVTQTILDQAGQIASTSDSIGVLRTISRNEQNQIDSVSTFKATSRFTYDQTGNLASVSDMESVPGTLFSGRKFEVGIGPVSVSTVDINGDGILDIVTTNGNSEDISVLLGQGDDTFGSQQVLDGDFFILNSVTVVDIDGDGAVDIVAADGRDMVSVLLGLGDGTFARQQQFETGDFPWEVATGDLNNDGWLDIVTANGGSRGNDVSVLLGLGDGTFDSQQRFDVGDGPRSVAIDDFNSDGSLDLVTTNSGSFNTPGSTVSVLLGLGDGTFSSQQLFEVGDEPWSVSTADLNDDGWADIVTTNYRSNDVSVLFGLGDGTFTNQVRYDVGKDPKSVTVGDINDDGRQDLVIADEGGFFSDGNVSVLLGLSDGTFDSQQPYDVGSAPRAISIVDINNDGLQDLVTANSDSGDVSLLLGFGDGTFPRPQTVELEGTPFHIPVSVAVADFNDDGSPDLVTANDNSDNVSVLLGLGGGNFANQLDFEVRENPRSVAVADFDGDGFLDLVTANSGSSIRPGSTASVLLGQGDGTFASQQLVEVGDRPESVATGDINSDGVLDLVTANSGSNNVSILLGQGDGTFANQQFLEVGFEPRSVSVEDFDRDGFLDLVAANSGNFDVPGSTVSVLFGLGDGTFASHQLLEVGSEPQSVTVADFNNDGSLDLVTANEGSNDVSVLLGLGDGTFTNQQRFDVTFRPPSVSVADIDSDGWLDIVAANGVADHVSVLLGLGDGTFADEQRFSVNNGADSVVVSDLNSDGRLDIVTVVYGEISLLLGLGSASGVPTRFTYDPIFNQLTSSSDELGRVTTYDIHPANGNTLAIHRPLGQTTQFIYNDAGQVKTITDPLLRVTENDYDSLGRLIAITRARDTADESIERFEYDAYGNRSAVIDGNGNRTEFEYDLLNRLSLTRDAEGNVTQFGYDNRGNVVSTIDAVGNTSEFRYDVMDRLIGTTDSIGNTSTNEYDLEGNLVVTVDPLGNSSQFQYDARNRLTTTVDADGGITQFTYDGNDNVTSLRDPVGNVTRFAYDSRDRLARETDPLGKITRYEYDAADNLVKKVDRNGRETEFEYDDLDRLDLENWFDSEGNVTNSIDYDYDLNNNFTAVDDAFSSLEFGYDSRERVERVDNAGTPNVPNVVLDYEYDAAGNVVSVVDAIDGSQGATTNYAFDQLNRTERISQTGDNIADKRVDFSYNELGQFEQIERYSDLSGQSLVVKSDYVYDSLNRIDSLTHTNSQPTNNVLAFYNFAYDSSSRITQIEDIYGTTDYGYDDRSQLTSATGDARDDESYGYDANGNRENSHLHGNGYVTGDGNRLLSDGTYNYEYDAEGNTILRTEISTGDYREFEWDNRNRLMSVTDFSAASAAMQTVEFAYDALDRRISKVVDTPASDEVATYFVYDREDVLLDFVDTDGASGPSSIELDQRYLHGPGIDQVLAQDDQQSTVNWHITDHLGSVTALVENDGGTTEMFQYDSFGKVITPIVQDTRYGYAGRELDSETKLIFNRARVYSTNAGVFLSEDPSGFSSGDHNLRRYVKNSPLAFYDPTGNVALWVIIVGGGFAVGFGIGVGEFLDILPPGTGHSAGVASGQIPIIAGALCGNAVASSVKEDLNTAFPDGFYAPVLGGVIFGTPLVPGPTLNPTGGTLIGSGAPKPRPNKPSSTTSGPGFSKPPRVFSPYPLQ